MKYLFFSVLVLLVSGCVPEDIMQNSQPKHITNNPPKWLDDPNYIKDKRNAVGCAYTHVNGENEQKKLAISRAIEQIALQKNSQVNVLTYRKKTSNGSTSNETSSLQSVDGQNISTKVIDTYKDRDNKLCVLVSEE